MHFHDKNSIPPRYVYLFLAIVCFVLLLFSVVFEDTAAPLKIVSSAIVTPMQSGVNKIGYKIYNDVTTSKEREVLLKENEELTKKINDMESEIQMYEQKTYELSRLQDLLELKDKYGDYESTGAHVIATDSTNWFSVFIIDKGSNDGISVGCNVLAGNGLCGIVIETGSNYSKVRSIIDDNSNVSAIISGTDILCNVKGDLNLIKKGYIDVGYINKETEIEDGAEIVTSDVSDKFLPGLLIGYLSDVKMDANNLTKSGKCTPVVDFSNIQEVIVILTRKEEINPSSENKNIYNNINSSTKNASDEKKNNSNKTTEGSTEKTEQTSSADRSSESSSDSSSERSSEQTQTTGQETSTQANDTNSIEE